MGAEEASRAAGEALKKNTDCIYFLASPLTCKKGSECEFRHAEGVRANPRDCWYWLNGNCLNPKCLFRHPPLELPFVAPPEQTSSTAQLPGSKLKIPCYYFQKGCCLKGDRCPFVHVPETTNNTYSAPAAKAPPHEQEPAIPQKPLVITPKPTAEVAAEARAPLAKKALPSSGPVQRLPATTVVTRGKTQITNGFEREEKKMRHHEDRLPRNNVSVEAERRPSREREGLDLRLRLQRKRNSEEDDRRRVVDDSGASSLSSRLRGRISLPEKNNNREHPVNSADFASPRSLAELRAAKFHDGGAAERRSRPLTPSQFQKSASFEGPKPLSEILKRKRRPMMAALGRELVIEDGEVNPESMNSDQDGPKPLSETLKWKQRPAIEDGEVNAERAAPSREPVIEDGEVNPAPTNSDQDGNAAPETADSGGYEAASLSSQETPVGDDAASDEEGDEFAREMGLIFS